MNNLVNDIKEPISYIPLGILVGAAGISVLLMVGRKRFTYRQFIWLFLLIVYGTVLCIQAFFSRESGSRSGIDLALFSTWGTTWQAHAYVIENVIMFLPLGVLLPALMKKWSSLKNICMISLGLSVSIELMQLVTSRGYCQADDILMNTLGGCLGYALRKILFYRR